MLGAKYDFSRDRERRAGVDDMVTKPSLERTIHASFRLGLHVEKYRSRDQP